MKSQTSTNRTRQPAAAKAGPQLPEERPLISSAQQPAGLNSHEASDVKTAVWRSNAAWLLIIGVISQLLPSAMSGHPVEPAWFWFLFGMLGFDFVSRGALGALTSLTDNRLPKQIKAA